MIISSIGDNGLIDIIIYSLMTMIILFTIFYLIALYKGIFNSIDIAYGVGFIFVAFITLILSNNWIVERKLIITFLVSLWGIHIVSFLIFRNYSKDEITNEDKRFKKFKDEWGKSTWWKGFLFLYLPQIILVVLVSLPLITINTFAEAEFVITDSIGYILVLIGLFFESVGNWQLYVFKKHAANKNKIITTDLWQFSQHPNYFGEMIIWWGFWTITLFGIPFDNILWGFFSVIGSILITLSLLKVSGINLLNKRFEGNLIYSDYQKKTSKLISWFPKKW